MYIDLNLDIIYTYICVLMDAQFWMNIYLGIIFFLMYDCIASV